MRDATSDTVVETKEYTTSSVPATPMPGKQSKVQKDEIEKKSQATKSHFFSYSNFTQFSFRYSSFCSCNIRNFICHFAQSQMYCCLYPNALFSH